MARDLLLPLTQMEKWNHERRPRIESITGRPEPDPDPPPGEEGPPGPPPLPPVPGREPDAREPERKDPPADPDEGEPSEYKAAKASRRGGSRRALQVIGIFLIAFVALIVAGAIILGRWISSNAREWTVNALSGRFNSEVELGALTISFFPYPSAAGNRLAIRHHGRRDVPPFIAIERFFASTSWPALLDLRVSEVKLDSLVITIPPKDTGPGWPKSQGHHRISLPIMPQIVADGTRLSILPRDRNKEPLEFDITRLDIHGTAKKGALRYQAELTNPKPRGVIHSNGTFGPWNADELGDTPLTGSYTFNHADLATFNGLHGILSATGSFKGALGRIETEGETDTPDFAVSTSSRPIRLRTQYHAIVDGTDGDTYLKPVKAQFLNSTVIADGAVEGIRGHHGKFVRLQVRTAGARVEDMLTLGVRSKDPLIRGDIRYTTSFLLPPGHADIMEKLQLDGHFNLTRGQFKDTLQDRLDSLSRKAQGKPKDTGIEDVASQFEGDFKLGGGKIALSHMAFRIPGADVQLDGDYGLRTEELAFRGRLLLDAKPSQTTTGIKSILLKAVDPLVGGKNKGTDLPITITGTRTSPKFGVDLKRKFAGP